MNVHKLYRVSRGASPDAGGPMKIVIDHAGALFNFRGAGAIEGPVASGIRTTAVLGSFLAIALGVWLFYRGVTSPKKWNLQTVGGFLLFSNGIGRLAENLNPEATAEGWAALAGGSFVKGEAKA